MKKKKASTLKIKVRPVKFAAKPMKLDPKKMEAGSDDYAKAAKSRIDAFARGVK